MTEVGTAYIDVQPDLNTFGRSLQTGVQRSTKGIGRTMAGVGKTIGLGIAAGAAAADRALDKSKRAGRNRVSAVGLRMKTIPTRPTHRPARPARAPREDGGVQRK